MVVEAVDVEDVDMGQAPGGDADGGEEEDRVVGRRQELALGAGRKYLREEELVGFVLLVAQADEVVDKSGLQLVESGGVETEWRGEVGGDGHLEL